MSKFPHSPEKIQNYLNHLQFFPTKKWGQNFLMDNNILQEIVSAACLTPQDAVLEIGPGMGHLTRHMADKVERLWAVEIDGKLCSFLQENFSAFPQLQILHLDALSSKHALNPKILEIVSTRPYKLVANLPYNISAPLLSNFLECPYPPSLIVVTVQKEVADRLFALPNTSDYGPLSVHTQLYAHVKHVRNIAPGAFYPAPKVVSSVVKIEPHPISSEILRPAFLFDVVRSVFNMRRKTISNALRHSPFLTLEPGAIEKALQAAQVAPERRGETLSPEEFILLANAFDRL